MIAPSASELPWLFHGHFKPVMAKPVKTMGSADHPRTRTSKISVPLCHGHGDVLGLAGQWGGSLVWSWDLALWFLGFFVCTIYIYIYIYDIIHSFLKWHIYIYTIHKQIILQITVIPMGKITKVLGTIKQTRSKHPKFLWEKQNSIIFEISMRKTEKVLGNFKLSNRET